MVAKVMVWGNEYLVRSVNWSDDGEINHISFKDESGKVHVAFAITDGEENVKGTKGGIDELLYMDLGGRLKWEK